METLKKSFISNFKYKWYIEKKVGHVAFPTESYLLLLLLLLLLSHISLTLCDPTDGSPPDSPIPGMLQARTLEWVAISFSNA